MTPIMDWLFAAVDRDTVEAIGVAIKGLREEQTGADWTFLYWVGGGIATAIVGIAAAAARAANWTATNVVLPLKDRHIRFMDKTEETQVKLTECTSSIVTKLDAMEDRQEKHIEICGGANEGRKSSPHV